MRHISNKLHLLALGLILGAAAFFRFWAAPLSAGPDVAQFWAFAKMFQLHGLDFYQYAAGNASIFPFLRLGFRLSPGMASDARPIHASGTGKFGNRRYGG